MLTVQQLIEQLQKIEDKSMLVTIAMEYHDPDDGLVYPESFADRLEVLKSPHDVSTECKIVSEDWEVYNKRCR